MKEVIPERVRGKFRSEDLAVVAEVARNVLSKRLACLDGAGDETRHPFAEWYVDGLIAIVRSKPESSAHEPSGFQFIHLQATVNTTVTHF